MIELAPIYFKPYLKQVLWGGNKICNLKGIPQDMPNIGESWEISAVPGHESVVAEGKYKNKLLSELIEEFSEELLGKMVVKKYGKNFPLLIKFIDANDNLSIQVHPDDKIASKRHGGLGKNEMWYIIDTDKGSKIYAGFKIQTNPEDYQTRIEEGTFLETVAVHDSKPDDVFYLPAGRVHSIGAGNLLAEIQESSDITYRIFDYNRTGSDGKKRELHTQEAKEVLDYTVYPTYKNPPVDNKLNKAKLVSCDHFQTYRLLVDGKEDFHFDDSCFKILICIEGRVKIIYEAGETELKAGKTILLPAKLTHITLIGKAKLLLTHP